MPLALAPALAASFPVFASLKSSLRPSEVTAEELSPWGDAEKQQSYSQGSFSASCCPLSRPAVTGCGLSQTLFFPAVKQLGSVMWENPWYWTYLCVRVCVSVAQCRLASASIFPAPSPSHGPSALVLPHLPSFYAFFTVSCKNTPPPLQRLANQKASEWVMSQQLGPDEALEGWELVRRAAERVGRLWQRHAHFDTCSHTASTRQTFRDPRSALLIPNTCGIHRLALC